MVLMDLATKIFPHQKESQLNNQQLLFWLSKQICTLEKSLWWHWAHLQTLRWSVLGHLECFLWLDSFFMSLFLNFSIFLNRSSITGYWIRSCICQKHWGDCSSWRCILSKWECESSSRGKCTLHNHSPFYFVAFRISSYWLSRKLAFYFMCYFLSNVLKLWTYLL